MKKLPKQISPDRIKDSIVEIRFNPNLPFEVAVGLLFNSLGDSYKFLNKSNEGNLENGMRFSIGQQYLFHNEKIHFQLTASSIVFNCTGQYIGWEDYRTEIEKVLKHFLNTNIADNVIRIGVRYISEYPDMDLRQCSNFQFSFGMPDVKSNTFSFRTEFVADGLKSFINLNSKMPVLDLNDNLIKPISRIDVDVIDDNIESSDLSTISIKMNTVHQKEKEIFFSLLNETFLNSLNPIY